jgi:hypothetical protein
MRVPVPTIAGTLEVEATPTEVVEGVGSGCAKCEDTPEGPEPPREVFGSSTPVLVRFAPS